MEYSDAYLEEYLPRRPPPTEFIPLSVKQEIEYFGRERVEGNLLVERSIQWTYAILDEIRRGQVFINWRRYGYEAWADWGMSINRCSVGLFDGQDNPGFGLILTLPPTDLVPRTEMVAVVEFPRLGENFPLVVRTASLDEHSLVHPVGATSAAWALCASTGDWGVLTAGHAVGSVPGTPVPLDQGMTGYVRNSRWPVIDAAFVHVQPPAGPPTTAMAVRKFPAAGQRVEIALRSGLQQRTVVEAPQIGAVATTGMFAAIMILDNQCSPGDSGALVQGPAQEAVGIYLGGVTTTPAPANPYGFALMFQQAVTQLNVTAFR